MRVINAKRETIAPKISTNQINDSIKNHPPYLLFSCSIG